MAIRPGTVVHFAAQMQPKQDELLDLIEMGQYGDVRFGGPKGGTKSHSIRTIAVVLAAKYEGLRIEIWRRTTQDLKDNHIDKLFNQEAPELRQFFNQQDMKLNFPNGSVIAFRYAETERDLRQQQGGEADIVMVDELSQWTETETRVLLKPRARRAIPLKDNPTFKAKFVGGFNWGDVSHTYNKRVCIDKEFTDTENPNDFIFVPMYGWDNAFWSMRALTADGLTIEDYFSWSEAQRQEYFIERSDYGKALFQLPEVARKQLLYGDPDVFEGMFFSMFSRKRHLDSVAKWELATDMNVLGSIDYGAQTVLEVAADDTENRTTFFGECWTEKSGAALRAMDIADFLIEHRLWKLNIICDTNMNFDPDDPRNMAKAPIEVFRKVIKAKFEAAGWSGKEPRLTIVTKISPTDKNYRVFCNEAWKNGLIMGQLRSDESVVESLEKQGYPISEIRIRGEECPKLVESMTSLVHDPKNHNGTDFDPKKGQDHAYDAAKMLYVNINQAREVHRTPLPVWFGTVVREKLQEGAWLNG